jgi:hypothetical protein
VTFGPPCIYFIAAFYVDSKHNIYFAFILDCDEKMAASLKLLYSISAVSHIPQLGDLEMRSTRLQEMWM